MNTSRISNCIIAGVALAALCGCGSSQPGTRLTFQVDTKAARSWPKTQSQRLAIMNEAKKITEEKSPNADVEVKDDDKLVVLLNGVTDPQAVASSVSAMTSTADIEFYHLKSVRTSRNPMAEWAISSDGGNATPYIFTGPNGQKINSLTQPTEVMTRIVDTKKNPPILAGRDILPNAKASFNARQQPVILIEFNKNATQTFREFTQGNIGEYLAVFYGGRLLTAPTIREAITGGRAEISGFNTLKEARDTADAINSGAQVVPLKVIKREVVKG